MFELATFGANYDFLVADKTFTGCTKVSLRYVGPFSAKRSLDMMDTLVFFSENFTLQKGPRRKSSTDLESEILLANVR